MSDADRDQVEINAIAAMTAAEVRAALRQYGLRPFVSLPPELSRLRAPEESHSRATIGLIEHPEETQSVLRLTPDREAARRNSASIPVWALTRWQLQWLKNGWGTFAFGRVLVALVAVLFVAFLAGITLERRVSANHPGRPIVDVEVVPASIYSGIVLRDFTDGEKLLIRKDMAPLFTSRCTEAFAKANLNSPLEVATREGVVLLPAKDLYRYPGERLGLASEVTSRAYWEEFSSGRAQAGTILPTRYGRRLTTDGRARVFLHDTAFLGESVLFARLSLTGVLTHEFIHVGGQPPTPGWFFQHDLKGFEHYDEIIGACR